MRAGRSRVALVLWAGLAVLSALQGPAAAERRPASMLSYCGFGTGPADSSIEPGGGADTLVIGDAGPVYHFVFDSSSPVTLMEHDRIIFEAFLPDDLRLERIGDNLAICHAANRYEMLIEGQYCGGRSLSTMDWPNHQIEEIVLVAAREVWLADVLFAEYRMNPGALPPLERDPTTGATTSRDGWRVRPFSQVLPDAGVPATSCAQ